MRNINSVCTNCSPSSQNGHNNTRRFGSTLLPSSGIFVKTKCVVINAADVYLFFLTTLVQTLRLCTGRTAHRESRGIALLFHDRGTRRGEGSASRPGRSLPPEQTRYALYRRLGGPQGRYGQVQKISPPPGLDPRTVQTAD